MKKYRLIPLVAYTNYIKEKYKLKYSTALLYAFKTLYPEEFKKISRYVDTKFLKADIKKPSSFNELKLRKEDEYFEDYLKTFDRVEKDPLHYVLYVLYLEKDENDIIKVKKSTLVKKLNDIKKADYYFPTSTWPYLIPVDKYIYKEKPKRTLTVISYALTKHREVILSAPPGWGKSTIIKAFADSIEKGEFGFTGIKQVFDVTNFIQAPLERSVAEEIVYKYFRKYDSEDVLYVIDPAPTYVNYQMALLRELKGRFLIAENDYGKDNLSQRFGPYKDYLKDYTKIEINYKNEEEYLMAVINEIAEKYGLYLTAEQLSNIYDFVKRYIENNITKNFFDLVHTIFLNVRKWDVNLINKSPLEFFIMSNSQIIRDETLNEILEETSEEILGTSEKKEFFTVKKETLKKIADAFEYVKTKRIFNQDEAIDRMKFYLLARLQGISMKKKPIASLLFAGKTGVGKTSCVEEVAAQLEKVIDGFGLLKFNMSEFSEAHRVSTFIGSPFGYIGFDRIPPIKKFVYEHPIGIILLDEIEKAHYDLFDLLLGVLDRGELRMGDGTTLDLTNYMIVMTSNITTTRLLEKNKKGIGFGTVKTEKKTKIEKLNDDELNQTLLRVFRPEFVNRIDKIIQFNPLPHKVYVKIVEKLKNDLLKESSVLKSVKLSDKMIEKILNSSNIETYGGREIARQFMEKVVEPMIEELTKHDYKQVDVFVDVNKIEIKEHKNIKKHKEVKEYEEQE